jgi:hypothetical protein
MPNKDVFKILVIYLKYPEQPFTEAIAFNESFSADYAEFIK